MKQLIVLLGAAGCSVSAILVRYSTAPTLILAFYRMLLAAMLSSVFLMRGGKERFRMEKRSLLLCAVSGVFLGLHFFTCFEAVRHTAVAQAVVLIHAEVLIVALASVAVFHSRLSTRAWLSVFVTLAGSALVALGDGGSGRALKGDLLAFCAAVCIAVYTLLGTACRRQMSNGVYSTLVYLFAALTVMGIALAQGLPLVGYDPVNYATALGMAVFCTLLGHSLFNWGLKYFSPSYISTLRLLGVPLSTLWAFLLFDEVPGLTVVIGSVLVILGIVIYSRSAVESA